MDIRTAYTGSFNFYQNFALPNPNRAFYRFNNLHQYTNTKPSLLNRRGTVPFLFFSPRTLRHTFATSVCGVVPAISGSNGVSGFRFPLPEKPLLPKSSADSLLRSRKRKPRHRHFFNLTFCDDFAALSRRNY